MINESLLRFALCKEIYPKLAIHFSSPVNSLSRLGNLTKLQKLALNCNALSGPVPNSFARLAPTLKYLDLSLNRELSVPRGTELECPNQVKVVKLLQYLGVLKPLNSRKSIMER